MKGYIYRLSGYHGNDFSGKAFVKQLGYDFRYYLGRST